MKYLKQVALPKGARTAEHGSTEQLTAGVYSIIYYYGVFCKQSHDMHYVIIGTEEEAQQPEQLKEQGQQADEVLKVNCERLEREMERLGNTFTLESSTLDARDKLAKIQVYTVC